VGTQLNVMMGTRGAKGEGGEILVLPSGGSI
jgi:hypothetical protein